MTKEEDETIYDEEGREDMVDDSEISPEEEGFMKGYDDADDAFDEKPTEDAEEGKKDEA